MIPESSIDILEGNPFFSQDQLGTFLSNDLVERPGAEINYRGAYQLGNLINGGVPQRNWKIKFSKKDRYRQRREWNFNYEKHPRHELTYRLIDEAGVPVASCRHVILYLNRDNQGLYVEYEDLDNKKWLTTKFGDNDGELYKAAFDVPNEPRFFAGLDDLGDTSEDYYWHYREKSIISQLKREIIAL